MMMVLGEERTTAYLGFIYFLGMSQSQRQPPITRSPDGHVMDFSVLVAPGG